MPSYRCCSSHSSAPLAQAELLNPRGGERSKPTPAPPSPSLPRAVLAPTARCSFSAVGLPTWSARSPVCPSAMCQCHLLAEIISRLCLTSSCVSPRIFEGRQARGQRALIEFFNVILIGSLFCDSYFFPSLSFSVLC